MDKGYYGLQFQIRGDRPFNVAIHNKNGQGLLQYLLLYQCIRSLVAIHNKNGQGLLQKSLW